MVEEPEPEVARVWLQGLKPRFEQYHSVKFAEDAIQIAIEAAQRFAPDRR